MRYMWWNNYMCEKPISPNGNEKDRERERARAWAPVLCSCQRHGGSSTTRRQARQRDQQPRNHGSRGKSPKGGGQRLGRARCEVHLCDVMHAHFYHDSLQLFVVLWEMKYRFWRCSSLFLLILRWWLSQNGRTVLKIRLVSCWCWFNKSIYIE